MKKYIAEALGTFVLTLVVALSIAASFPVSTPFLAALTLGLFVYSIGHLSGAHINPAVTVGAWSIRKITTTDALAYVISQFIGATVAFYIVSVITVMPALVVSGSSTVIIAEIIGTFFFSFGIASVIYGKTSSSLSGIVVGGSLLLGIALAVLIGSNGVLNPAVAFGIGSFNLVYLLAPMIGSVLGMNVYKYLAA